MVDVICELSGLFSEKQAKFRLCLSHLTFVVGEIKSYSVQMSSAYWPDFKSADCVFPGLVLSKYPNCWNFSYSFSRHELCSAVSDKRKNSKIVVFNL